MLVDGFAFRAITEQDLTLILQWRNNKQIRENMFTDHVITWEEHREWFLNLPENNNQASLLFVKDEVPLGVVQFQKIDKKNQRALWGFYLGEKKRPSGSSFALAELSLNYAFQQLNLHKLCGEVLAFNYTSQNYFQRLGFVQEGILRQHVLRQNMFIDVVIFGLLKAEWQATVSALFGK